MMLSTRGRYAVMAMLELVVRQESQPLTLASISESQEIPLAYLEQIFSKLRKAGLVQSVRGPGGGYQLARAANDIHIAEIVLASEEVIHMTRCDPSVHAQGCMSDKTRCMTHDLWDGLSGQIYHYLQSLSLEDVAQRRIKEKFPTISENIPEALAVEFLMEESATLA